MTHATFLIRSLFMLVSILFMIAFTMNTGEKVTASTYLSGALYGFILASTAIVLDRLLKKISFRFFNLTIVGLIFGYLMSLCLLLIFTTFLDIALFKLSETTIALCKLSIFLSGLYLGVILSYRYSEELCITIPFVRLQPTMHKNKSLLLDSSALADSRIIDLAATGLLNRRILIPRFLLNELQNELQCKEEVEQQRSKRSLENLKRLELMPQLEITYQDGDLPENKSPIEKSIHFARLFDADVLTAEIGYVQKAESNVTIISLHDLSKALKPIMQSGEQLSVKIQRLGKEEKQGVGYLEDGTMVVVNGGGTCIGSTITAHVLSVKHTQSGRLVFCNIAEDGA